jgi:hypothetical protein
MSPKPFDIMLAAFTECLHSHPPILIQWAKVILLKLFSHIEIFYGPVHCKKMAAQK